MEQIHFLERIQHTVFKEIGEVPEMLFAPEFPVGCRKLNLMVSTWLAVRVGHRREGIKGDKASLWH